MSDVAGCDPHSELRPAGREGSRRRASVAVLAARRVGGGPPVGEGGTPVGSGPRWSQPKEAGRGQGPSSPSPPGRFLFLSTSGRVLDALRELLPACLASLRVAARHPALRRLQVHVIPVLDACSDDSGAVAPGGLEVQARNVGVARTAGFAAALAREAGRAAQQLWLATTDADSTVPADWLAKQLRLAALGVEVVAGTGPGLVRAADRRR